MSGAIYYFSGTKNSYLTALKLGKNLPSTEVINVFDAPLNIEQDSVGLVFPVHSYNVPKAIKEFIQRSDFSKVQYIYAICTSGGDAGNVFYYLNKLLLKKGKILNRSDELKLGDNSMVISTDSNVLKTRVGTAKKILETISGSISGRLNDNKVYKYSILKDGFGFFINLTLARYYRMQHKSIDTTRCNKCGKCIKTCSSKNIRFNKGIISFGDKCYDCFGCINVCSRKAITFGKISPDKYRQYVQPEFLLEA